MITDTIRADLLNEIDFSGDAYFMIMKTPKMILFDYGQTLIDQKNFDGVKGTEAVLKYATKNKYDKTAAEIQALADSINRDLRRADPMTRHLNRVEVPNHMFTAYLYASQGIELSLSAEEIDQVFWDAAAPGVPTESIGEFLSFVAQKNIRTGVISNISFCGKAVEERIHSLIPENRFEFILATSEYLFRKPDRRIFELALEMAELSPEEVWYVGDDYECDVKGAAAAGLFPVWYIGAMDLPYQEHSEILTIRDWRELIEILIKIAEIPEM